ncbi:MAG: hypothetical protein SGJ04_06420 [Bacteroidota bacterium]|nr:hypothetical protein [Bacteroidota bacterium]
MSNSISVEILVKKSKLTGDYILTLANQIGGPIVWNKNLDNAKVEFKQALILFNFSMEVLIKSKILNKGSNNNEDDNIIELDSQYVTI